MSRRPGKGAASAASAASASSSAAGSAPATSAAASSSSPPPPLSDFRSPVSSAASALRSSAPGAHGREYDLIVLGATGYTGELVAAYLATIERDGRGIRWAMAGRSMPALEAARRRALAGAAVDVQPSLLIADTEQPATLARIAALTAVIVNCAGPFVLHGPPVIEACIVAGTHYVDLTGEPNYYDDAVRSYHAAAEKRGVCIVPACGLDSLPVDFAVLNALYTPLTGPAVGVDTVEVYMRLRMYPSFGTVMSGFESVRGANFSVLTHVLTSWTGPLTFKLVLRLLGRLSLRHLLPSTWFYSDLVNAWVLPIMPVLDGRVVRRSAHLLAKHVNPTYPTDFLYSQYLVVTLPFAWLLVPLAALLMAIFLPILVLVLKFPPFYSALQLVARLFVRRGPSAETRATTTAEIIAASRSRNHEIRRVIYLAARDPGYGTTAKWIAECGVALARDEHLHPLAWPLSANVRAPARPLVGGVLTPSACFGFPLLDSFKARGLLLTQLGKQ